MSCSDPNKIELPIILVVDYSAHADGQSTNIINNLVSKIHEELKYTSSYLETLKCLMACVEMPDDEKPEEYAYETSVSSLPDKYTSIVRVDAPQNRDNYYLEGMYGNSVSIMGQTNVARCQCYRCKPDEATTVMFRIDDRNDKLTLTNSLDSGGDEILSVIFEIQPNEQRQICDCCKTKYWIAPKNLTNPEGEIEFLIDDKGITVKNTAFECINFRGIIEPGGCTHIRNNDIIEINHAPVFTVRSNTMSEKEPNEDDLGGWFGEDDWN